MNKNEYELIIELYEFLMTNIDLFFESPGLLKTEIKTENPNDAFIFGKILGTLSNVKKNNIRVSRVNINHLCEDIIKYKLMFDALPENLKNKVVAYNL
jgi:hypothetical protein